MRSSSLASIVLGLALAGCPSTPAPTDAPVAPSDTPASCPRMNVPSPEEQMLPCCYRVSQADQLDAPEARLRFLDITAPAGSPLAGSTVGDLLNTSLREETFNWLFRLEGADADGPVTITTGFGRRETDGTYTFAAATDPTEWAPVNLMGTITGESVTSERFDGTLTVPIFNEEMTTVQIELELEQVSVLSTTLSENRSCIGRLRNAVTFDTAATLGGFITVESARAGMIMYPGIDASLCGVVAGSLLDPDYCAQPQSDWMVQPDSICDATGCQRNGMGGTCDPATTCNAWYLEADFAAVGIDIQ